MLKFIEGGVCAAQGFKASGLHVGVKTKKKEKKDIALIASNVQCNAAAVYTSNVVKAAPLLVTQKHLANGKARAVFANSGNANACAMHGEENAVRMANAACKALIAESTLAAAKAAVMSASNSPSVPASPNGADDSSFGILPSDIIVASTGVIGQTLPIEVIENGVAELAASLSASKDGSIAAAEAIMTTDLARKEAAAEFIIGGRTLRIGGIAKGSGMIHPNMGTMLAFLTTDCAISNKMIQTALQEAAKVSFNRISVDGDTSTNDMLTLMANGLGGNEEITAQGEDYRIFFEALCYVCTQLAKMMASDGEGATHLITCKVSGAFDETAAEALAKSVISSSLVKAAMFGADANWGRVLCAMGYAGVAFNPESVSVSFVSNAGKIKVCENGRGLDFDEAMATKILKEHDIIIDISLSGGSYGCECWGCDLTYDYVRINGDYRT